ncbi:hypothetical protein [Mesorhizobium sp. INR15]|uniref:hypothetical protein n=1 Tax=Mesorhizobium sp. INR15 TaxID=2654248 RepID=UPI0018965105|nr:hypothetical protein [Mesorhizobium sp. INR15]QPC92597.1 hypothetical protein GA829_19530 [Mesorhizobium sp. INR15]
MSYSSDDGMMRMPNPIDSHSGWTDRSDNPGYASGSAPGPAPEGKVFIPGMNTYVDRDIAEELGLMGPQGNSNIPASNPAAFDPRAVPAGDDPLESIDFEELSDADLEALQQELEIETDHEPGPSETFDDIADCFDPADFNDGLDAMVATGDVDDTLRRLSDATGMDPATASVLIETTVMETAPVASEHIGGDRWDALVYAASRTDDPFARRIVTDMVAGNLHPSKLAGAYDLWFQSLPDVDG